ncbi:MAG: biosynthetic-type acetolactate synthase large subunit [Bacteroidia bacterium]|nr:biosynthetic-type acetolactate synthase large subunit [Bacteroidia bacterium]
MPGMLKTQVKAASQTKHEVINGAEAVMQAIIGERIDTIFGYPGGAIMPVYDALFDYRDKVEHILVRHEQGAVHAAQGYARATGKMAVVFATSGPGATNLVTGLADAMIDSTPLVCITGQVPSALLGKDAFQESDVISLTMPVTKWNYQLTDPNEIPEVLARAFYLANSGRPGPVLIDITKDCQLKSFEYKGYSPCQKVRSYRPKPIIRPKYIEQAAEIINSAKKPFLIWGQGVLLGGAESELKKFVEKTGIPAAWTILGASALPTDHPLNVGMVGMHGNYAPNVLTNQCDVLIAIGMRFDDRVTGNVEKYASQAKIIHLDIDPAEFGKIIKPEVQVWGDCKETLPLLIDSVHPNQHREWKAEFDKLARSEYEEVIQNEIHPQEGELTMGEVIEVINELDQGNSILITDVGQHQMITYRYAKFTQSRSKITSGGLGTMGFSLPAGIGAQVGLPERSVISISGDGGFQMCLQELGTIMQHKIPLKILILNNHYLGMVRQWQEMFHDNRYSFVDIESPDYVKLADSYGIPGKSISERDDLKDGVRQMLEAEGAFVLEVHVTKENNVFPFVPPGASVSDIKLK